MLKTVGYDEFLGILPPFLSGSCGTFGYGPIKAGGTAIEQDMSLGNDFSTKQSCKLLLAWKLFLVFVVEPSRNKYFQHANLLR